jgi:peptidoglycan/xylan/chitin deacetylase (PgdA/CDA1 family)
MFGARKLKRITKRILGSLRGRAIILLYHRVARLSLDPQLLSVTPEHFGEHLDIMRNFATPLTLRQLVEGLNIGRIPRRAVVLTFDDGYADNLRAAKPLLAKKGVPATVFVTAGYVGKEREFWWDEVERLLLQPGTLPEEILLNIGERMFRWDLDGSCRYGEIEAQRFSSWHAMERTEPTRRHSVYKAICQVLRPLPERDKREALSQLILQTGAEPKPRSTHRPLSAGELLHLADGGLIDVGAHTLTHPVLASLPAEDQRTEIEESKVRLEAVLGLPIRAFAYPFGTQADYTSDTTTIVKNSGFTCACSNFVGAVAKDARCFELPRNIVRNWDGAEFEERLERWFYE